MDEAEKFCENCKRHVSAANFASHSAFCERNVKVCEICDEPFQVSLEEGHLEECHAVIPCNLCEQPVEKWLLSKHQEVCVKRPIQCEFCDLKLPFDKYREHDDFCGSRTEKCLLCQKYIMLKEKQQHTEFHRHGRKVPKDNSKTKLYRTHAVEASSQLGACKLEETEKSVVRDNPVEPEEQNWVNEAISLSKSCGNSKLLKDSEDDVFTCPVCKQLMLFINRRSHVCMRENGTTSGNEESRDAGVAASIGDVKEDSKHFTTCHVCKERIRWMDYNIHVPTCATVRGRCSVCGERVASGEMKDHMRRCSKNSQKAEPVERMETNLRNSARPTVPGHGACYSESYECPLCSEKIPESDKQKHESFFCKVLLDLDKPDNFSSITNFDFSKASQERSKKVSSELSVTGSTKSSGKFRTEEYPRYPQGNGYFTFMGHNEFKGAMPKYSSKIVIPTSGRCKHCKTFLNHDILSIHEEQCIHQEINCPDCDDGLKLMDADRHTCRWTKLKGKHDKKNAKPKDSDGSGWNWGIGGFFSRKSRPQDKSEKGRNKSYSEITANRFQQTPEDTSAFQHFPQTCIDDTKIPCEFCNELFLVHDLIVHETGCRPEEVSFAKPKPEKAAKVEERKPDALKRSDRAGQSHVPGGNFFGDSGKPPSSKNKSHKRHQDSSFKPGEFLDINRLELEDKKNVSQSLVKKPNPSAIFSVWNGDSSDEMYEETPTKVPPSEEAPEKNSHTIENGKSVSDEEEEFYSGSDGEVSEMLHFIYDSPGATTATQPEESPFPKTVDEIIKYNIESLKAREEFLKEFLSQDSPGATTATQPEESPFPKTVDEIIKYNIESLKAREEFLKEFLSQDPTGATAATQPEETPFKEAFDYILKSREELLTQDKACWNPSKIHQNEETFDKERENVGINLNENQKVQESFSSAKENHKKMYSPPPLPRWLTSLPSTDGGESDVCRICHGEGDRESLVTPCRCAGTLRYVHQSCLQQWIRSSHIHRCELCHSMFRIRPKTKP